MPISSARAEKNRAAWEDGRQAGGHRDYTLRILPEANHALLEAKVGNNADTRRCSDSCPATLKVVVNQLSKRIRELRFGQLAAASAPAQRRTIGS